FTTGILIVAALRKWRIQRVFFLTFGFICAITLFGFPLSNSFSDNPGYKSMSGLKTWHDSTGLSVYEFTEASPELVWAYGKPIPMINKQCYYMLHDENQFCLLASEETKEKMQSTFSDYTIKKAGYYDMNPRAKEHG